MSFKSIYYNIPNPVGFLLKFSVYRLNVKHAEVRRRQTSGIIRHSTSGGTRRKSRQYKKHEMNHEETEMFTFFLDILNSKGVACVQLFLWPLHMYTYIQKCSVTKI